MTGYIFISYTHEDTRFALRLARQLQRLGLTVWLDQWETVSEFEWDRAIERQVKGCRYFLMILSPGAVNSWVVQEQFLWAKEAGRPVISVLCRPCELPPPLQALTPIDFTGRNFQRGVEQLLAQYFPMVDVRLGLWAALKLDLTARLRYGLRRLGPLLWPGWLGPALLLLLLFIAIVYFRNAENRFVAPEPRYETLAIAGPSPTPVPVPTPRKTRMRAVDGQLMVQIPAGEFLMGSPPAEPGANDDEVPQHGVYLDTFWIDKTEITVSQYRQCELANACTPPKAPGINYRQCVEAGICTSLLLGDGVTYEDVLPVVGVTWEQASDYCGWAGVRLPTEAEWEKAARGTDGRRFPWGDTFDGSRLNHCDRNCLMDMRDGRIDDGFRYVAPIGSYPQGASPYGVLDMSGNVWEWTADWYAPDLYTAEQRINPAGPQTGTQRVIRGGAWTHQPGSLRAARRHRDVPTTSHNYSGFRCALSGAEALEAVDWLPGGSPDMLVR